MLKSEDKKFDADILDCDDDLLYCQKKKWGFVGKKFQDNNNFCALVPAPCLQIGSDTRENVHSLHCFLLVIIT